MFKSGSGKEKAGEKKRFPFKKILLFALPVLVLVGAGLFYYFKMRPTPPEEWDEADYSPVSEYKVKEKGGEKWVENRKVGISFRVPEGWRVEKGSPGSNLYLYSPNAKGSTLSSKGITSGCELIIEVKQINTNITTLEKELKELHAGKLFSQDTYEGITVDDKKALSNTAEMPPLHLTGRGVHIPYANKLYSLSLNSRPEDKAKCSKTFESFLETVSIE